MEEVEEPVIPAARDPIGLASLAASLALLSPLGGNGSWKGEQGAREDKEEPLANLTSPPTMATPVMDTPVSTRGLRGRPRGPGAGGG